MLNASIQNKKSNRCRSLRARKSFGLDIILGFVIWHLKFEYDYDYIN